MVPHICKSLEADMIISGEYLAYIIDRCLRSGGIIFHVKQFGAFLSSTVWY